MAPALLRARAVTLDDIEAALARCGATNAAHDVALLDTVGIASRFIAR